MYHSGIYHEQEPSKFAAVFAKNATPWGVFVLCQYFTILSTIKGMTIITITTTIIITIIITKTTIKSRLRSKYRVI